MSGILKEITRIEDIKLMEKILGSPNADPLSDEDLIKRYEIMPKMQVPEFFEPGTSNSQS